jgi:hypothetical protein
VTDPQPPGGGQNDPLLRAVARYWEEIQGLAREEQLGRLRGLLDGTAEPDPAEARAALADELLDLLPPDHPVIRVLRTGVLYSGGTGTGTAVRHPGAGFPFGSVTLSAGDSATLPVTIYLADEHIHTEVETAVEALLAVAGLRIEDRDDPVLGSWFRRMIAGAKESMHSAAGQDAALTAAHAVDSRMVLAQDADVTARLLQNLAPVLGALQPTKDAVIRAGALLVVKTDWEVSVFQLTAAQQARLDHSPQLARSPHDIVAALCVTDGDHRGVGKGTAATLDLYVEEPVLGRDTRFVRETGVSFGQLRVAPVPDDELPAQDQLRPDLPQLRLTSVRLPFDLEVPPVGWRYTETTVRITFDNPRVLALRLSQPSAGGDGEGPAGDSVLSTFGVGRPELTWQMTAGNDQVGLRPSGREVLAVVESPLASVWLTGTLDASVRFTRRLLGIDRYSPAEPRRPLRFSLNVADGSFHAGPEGEPGPGQ